MARSTRKPVWNPDWSKAPKDAIGASFNADGVAWFWSVKPSIKGSEKRPWDKKWRGPSYGEGYTEVPDFKATGVQRSMWEYSFVEKPKT